MAGAERAKTILPGATIGIFGGGQLGRMTAMAARGMGYRLLVLDPDPACPARFVVDECIEAGWDDSRQAANLARQCDVVTLEIEQISAASMAAARCAVRPLLRITTEAAAICSSSESKRSPAAWRITSRQRS